MAFDILRRVRDLAAVNLTIREQTRLAENPLELRWRDLAPYQEANSTRFSDIETVDFRPIATHRAWNAQGREIHEVLGPQVSWNMIPVTARHTIDEERLQELAAPAPDIAALVERGIVKDVDAWATTLADAVDRTLEAKLFEAWATNLYTIKDAKTGTVVTANRGIAAGRYVTEATAWNDPAVNAYDRLMFHIREAVRMIGSVGAIRARRATWDAVTADAPAGANAVRTTFANLQDRVREEGYGDIALIVDERTYDDYTDGGSEYTTKNYVPTGRVLFQPADGRIGVTPHVPVVRAFQYVGRDQRANIRDVQVFYHEQNMGRALVIEAEKIAVPVPAENRTYVVNAGV